MSGYGFTLAVCAEMVFRDQPIPDRVRHIHDLGFAVEIWDWTAKDLSALAATGARFTSMTGYIEGNLTEPDGAEALLRTAEESIAAAAKLGTPPSANARVSCSAWRTSTPPSTTLARRSPRQRTPAPWSRPSAVRICG
jgi:hypothetical protein